MTSPASRAGALAAIGGLSVLAPIIGAGTAVLFATIALLVLLVPSSTSVFTKLATRHDLEIGQLRTLAGFLLVVAVLALLGTVDAFRLSAAVFSMTVLIVSVGHGAELLARSADSGPGWGICAFVGVGATAGYLGYLVHTVVPNVEPSEGYVLAGFLVVLGALIAGLYRTELARDDPMEVISVGLLLWFFASVGIGIDQFLVIPAILVSIGLGGIAYITETASIAGMLSGILLAMIAFVVGGFAWFVTLTAFFAIGGLATKYRYAEKAARGVAESDSGSRGTANVMSNGLVPLVLVVVWAAFNTVTATEHLEILDVVIVLAFCGAVATALADTLASEIGALYDNPRLITSLEAVRPGTDGAVTIQGHLAGIIGAGIVGIIGTALFAEVGVLGGAIVTVTGVLGMTADSVLGATLEGRWVGNDLVNFLSTIVGALSAGVLGLILF